jgi:hypothetical protein
MLYDKITAARSEKVYLFYLVTKYVTRIYQRPNSQAIK